MPICVTGKNEFLGKLKKSYTGVVFFGAGKHIHACESIFKEDLFVSKILYVIDNDKEKADSWISLYGRSFPVNSVSKLVSDIQSEANPAVVITVKKYFDICWQIIDDEILNKADCYIMDFFDIMEQDEYAMKQEVPASLRVSNTPLIPKVIHYCWFGKNPLPDNYKRWMESWKKFCPDYEIKRWDESNYDVSKNKYMLQAYNNKKWGFVSDYARLDIIYNHGGIYLDTDVELVTNLDELLYQKAFCGFQSDYHVNFGLGFGAQKGFPIIKEILDWYNDKNFEMADGRLNLTPCPIIQTDILMKHGLLKNGVYQILDDLTVYPEKMLCAKNNFTRIVQKKLYTRAIHHFDGSWLSNEIKDYIYKKESVISNIFNLKPPKVSIVTVVYNAADTVERTIKSVLSQTYKNIEYIIIDGGSTDGTLEIISKYEDKLAYFVSEKDNGIFNAMNKGILKATGDIIGIINADDWYESDAVKKVVVAFASSGAGVVSGDVWFRHKNQEKYMRFYDEEHELENFWYEMPIAHPATFVKTELYKKFGLFDESFKLSADYDFCLKLYAANVKFEILKKDVLANFTLGGESMTQILKCSEETRKVTFKHLDECPCKSLVKGKMRKRMRESLQWAVWGENKPSLDVRSLVEKCGITADSPLVIWGAGSWGRKVLKLFRRCGIEPKFFVDSNVANWDTKIENLSVKRPEELQSFDGIVFIATKNGGAQIEETILSWGIKTLTIVGLKVFLDNLNKYAGTEKTYKIMYFISDGYSLGGAGNTTLRQAMLMSAAGHECLIAFSNKGGAQVCEAYKKACLDNGLKMTELPFTWCSHTEGFDVSAIIQDYEGVKNAIKTFVPDFLHSSQINPTVELVSRELRIPHIMNIYQADKAFFSQKYLDIFPKYHICDSELYANKWSQGLGCKSTCIRTVVIDHNSKKSALNRGKETIYVVSGGLYERKNQLAIIKAFSCALSSGIRAKLYLCGDETGYYGKKCIDYIKNNLLDDKVFVRGFCTDMKTIYKNCDVLICGSTCESYPNAVSEALANSLVVISTPVAGVPELIKDGVNGYLTAGYTETDIYKKIMQFEADKVSGIADKILKEANRTFNYNHSAEVVTENLIDFYQFVLKDFSNINKSPTFSITELKEIFDTFTKRYNNTVGWFMENSVVTSRIWYIYHIRENIKKLIKDNTRFYIWGAGKWGKYTKGLLSFFFEDISFSGFIDSEKTGELNGYPIFKPEIILSQKDSCVFLGVLRGQYEIIEKLENAGYECNKNYFIIAPRSW